MECFATLIRVNACGKKAVDAILLPQAIVSDGMDMFNPMA
jgi:hypothetical protein